jgi:hypothetical protein
MAVDRAKAIERIRKLLALAQDGAATEAEAALAMEKAMEAMAAAGVSEHEVRRAAGEAFGEEDLEGFVLTRYRGRSGVPESDRLIVGCLKMLFGLESTIWQFVDHWAVQLVGFRDDAIAAGFLWEYLIRSRGRALRGSGIAGAVGVESFRLGYGTRLYDRVFGMIERRRRLESPDCKGALVRQEKAALVKGWMARQGYGVYKDTSKVALNREAFRAGANAADAVSLDKPSGARRQLAG